MIPLTNYDFQWGRSEVVIIYPDIYTNSLTNNSLIYGYEAKPWHPDTRKISLLDVSR